MKRRSLLQGMGAGLGASALWSPSHAVTFGLLANHRQTVPEIFDLGPRPPSHSPALIIGSGFGGAISALRLAQAGVATTVLERGFRWPKHDTRAIFSEETNPDGRGFWFRNTSATPYGLTGRPIDVFGGVMDVTDYENIAVWRGAAVGGGSVVFTGVMIQPERKYFDAIFQNTVAFDEMNARYYPRVRQMLRLSPMPADIYLSAPFSHSRRWNRDMIAAGYSPQRVDGIWNWKVVRNELKRLSRASCIAGESNLGNSNGAKFDLNQNYLADAQATGKAAVYPGQEVKNIGFDGSRYLVDVQQRSPDGTLLERRVLTCDRLILAAGSIGSSELLVRAQATGTLTNLNEHVGQGWGTNGDTAVGRVLALDEGLQTGAACASKIHDARGALPVTLENWYTPGIPVGVTIGAHLGMGLDLENRAAFKYESTTDRVNLLWPANGNDAVVAATREVNNRVASASRTLPSVIPPLLTDVYAGYTAHPLGGLVIGKATDAHGRVKGYKGLYVMDGALVPGSTGAVNPSLTISALAERNIEHIIAAGG